MFYLVDNYDSFVYNLAAYIQENGHDVVVCRADEASVSEIRSASPEGILISPGPGHPKDATASCRILQEFQNEIPILGVCLGHQVIGHFFGANICKGQKPMHGKVCPIEHEKSGLFDNIPDSFLATRYHSLIISERKLPSSLRVTARTADGVVMGIAHTSLPIYGVQFHPEAVRTQYGHELLENFHALCQDWWRLREKNGRATTCDA